LKKKSYAFFVVFKKGKKAGALAPAFHPDWMKGIKKALAFFIYPASLARDFFFFLK
jgi:hypothetical protein